MFTRWLTGEPSFWNANIEGDSSLVSQCPWEGKSLTFLGTLLPFAKWPPVLNIRRGPFFLWVKAQVVSPLTVNSVRQKMLSLPLVYLENVYLWEAMSASLHTRPQSLQSLSGLPGMHVTVWLNACSVAKLSSLPTNLVERFSGLRDLGFYNYTSPSPAFPNSQYKEGIREDTRSIFFHPLPWSVQLTLKRAWPENNSNILLEGTLLCFLLKH